MTPEELTEARARLGLTARAFAGLLDVRDRTVRAWENRDSNATPIPRTVEIIVSLALEFPAVRRKLGIHGRSKKSQTKPTRAESEQTPPG